MYERVVVSCLSAVALYLALGFAFAIAFVTAGIAKIDHEARESGLGFRLLMIPGTTALWPLLLSRWLRGNSDAPVQKDPHR